MSANNLKLSLVLLTYTLNETLAKMSNRAFDSYRDQVDEAIVAEDGGLVNPYLFDKSSKYVKIPNAGFTRNANQGWKMAQGEYVAIVSNDTYLVAGNLRDLCVKGTVTSPKIENQVLDDAFAGCFFVVPKEVSSKVGLLDESMHTYYSDTEYLDRLQKRGIPTKIIDSVVIHHDQAQTVNPAGQNTPEQSYKDKGAYDLIPKL